MVFCKNCRHSEINFWGYTECWKFDQQMDLDTTKHTAIREKHAQIHNGNFNCFYYEPKNFWQKIKDYFRK